MDSAVEVFLGMGYFLNPIFAIVFCFNLVEIISKLVKGNEKIGKNHLWLTISFTYIVTFLTWMWGSPQ